MRDYVRRLLESRFDVRAFADGEAALAEARMRPPDLLLSDVMMLKLDRFGLLREVRADARLCKVPLILLSARAGEEAKIEGLDAGADDYLVKPFSARELVARIQTNLQMAQIRRVAEDSLRKRIVELETLLETVPISVWFTYDSDARRVSGNRHASALLRIPVAADGALTTWPLEPQPYRLFRDGIEAAAHLLPIQRAARGEDAPGEELEIRFDDGGAATIFTSAAPLRDATGEMHGAVCAAIDITKRKRDEKMRAERESEFRALADNMSQFAWMADAAGWIYWYNRRWFDYTGATLEEMRRLGWRNVLHPDHFDRVEAKRRLYT